MLSNCLSHHVFPFIIKLNNGLLTVATISPASNSMSAKILPEIVDTFLMLFDSINLPLQVAAYCLVELEVVKPEYFVSPKCQNVNSTISIDVLEDLEEYMSFCLASYAGTYYSLTEEFFQEAMADGNQLKDNATNLTRWMTTNTEEKVRLLIDWHTTAASSDIVALYYPNKQTPFRCCYYIVKHRERKEVIVCIRGTLSIQDCLIDLVASAVPFMEGYVHKGMLRTAKNMLEEIKTHLAAALRTVDEDYRVVVTGHSLGAGVSSILTMMLHEEYPDIKCYAFACPSVFTSANVVASEGIVTTVVNGADIIPRLSYQSFHNLSEDMLKLLEHRLPPSVLEEGTSFASRVVRKRIHTYMQGEYQKQQDRQAVKMIDRKKQYWQAERAKLQLDGVEVDDVSMEMIEQQVMASGQGSPDDDDFDPTESWWKRLPIYQTVRKSVTGINVKKLFAVDGAGSGTESEREKESGDDILLLPLLPPGRVVQMSPPDKETIKELEADHKSWMRATGRAKKSSPAKKIIKKLEKIKNDITPKNPVNEMFVTRTAAAL